MSLKPVPMAPRAASSTTPCRRRWAARSPSGPAPDRRRRQVHGRRFLQALRRRDADAATARRRGGGAEAPAGRRPAPWRASCRSSASARRPSAERTRTPRSAGGRMENLDVMVLRTLRDWRRPASARCWRRWCAPGARRRGRSARSWRWREDGAVVGSVSGGCIEDDLISRYSRAHGGDGAMPVGRAGARQVRHHRRRGAPLRPALRRHAGAAARIRPRRRVAGRPGGGARSRGG